MTENVVFNFQRLMRKKIYKLTLVTDNYENEAGLIRLTVFIDAIIAFTKCHVM